MSAWTIFRLALALAIVGHVLAGLPSLRRRWRALSVEGLDTFAEGSRIATYCVLLAALACSPYLVAGLTPGAILFVIAVVSTMSLNVESRVRAQRLRSGTIQPIPKSRP